MARPASAALILLCAACRSVDVDLVPADDAGTSVALPGLEALRIDPTSLRIADDGAPPGETARFRAFGRFKEGEREVTDEVEWSLDDVNLGTIDHGTFTSAGLGGRTLIEARSAPAIAEAELEVSVAVVNMGHDVPANAPDLFGSATATEAMDASMLSIIYPSDETMLPQNAANIWHEWRADPSLDLFQVSFENALTRFRYYTVDNTFAPDAAAWKLLASANGGGSLQMTVRGLAKRSPETVYRSLPITLYYARAEIPGAAYYWSTATRGIKRATLDSRVARQRYPRSDHQETECAGCHAISRDGRKLALSYDDHLRIIELPSGEVVSPAPGAPANGPRAGWATFDPSGATILLAHEGHLALYDGATGEKIRDFPLPGRPATHPDWSPDGSLIAVAYLEPRIGGEDEAHDKRIEGSSIAVITVTSTGGLETPRVIVHSSGHDDTLAHPSFSPDGAFIAFARMHEDSRDNSDARLYLVSKDGGAPISMDRLNRRSGDNTGATRLGNTMPTWAPSSRSEIAWLSFTSIRDYGSVLAGARRDQLWISAIDLSHARAGDDPSYSAFWAPFQAIDEGNHRALWSSNADDAFVGGCASFVEQCGNAIDDDCDGVADEACSCGVVEICGNGIDDDCNGDVDGADRFCGGE